MAIPMQKFLIETGAITTTGTLYQDSKARCAPHCNI